MPPLRGRGGQAPPTGPEAQPDHAGVAAPGVATASPPQSPLPRWRRVVLAMIVTASAAAPAQAAVSDGHPNHPLFDATPPPNATNEQWDLASRASASHRGISVDRAWPLTTGAGTTLPPTPPHLQGRFVDGWDFYARGQRPDLRHRECLRERTSPACLAPPRTTAWGSPAGIAPSARLMPLRTSTSPRLAEAIVSFTPPTTAPTSSGTPPAPQPSPPSAVWRNRLRARQGCRDGGCVRQRVRVPPPSAPGPARRARRRRRHAPAPRTRRRSTATWRPIGTAFTGRAWQSRYYGLHLSLVSALTQVPTPLGAAARSRIGRARSVADTAPAWPSRPWRSPAPPSSASRLRPARRSRSCG